MPFKPHNSGFGGGKKGRSGRPRKSDELEMRVVLAKDFPPAKRSELIRHLVTLAVDEDNLQAATILLNYTWGKPTETTKLVGDEEQPVVYKVKWPNVSKSD